MPAIAIGIFFPERFYQEEESSYALNYKVYEWKTIFNESFINLTDLSDSNVNRRGFVPERMIKILESFTTIQIISAVNFDDLNTEILGAARAVFCLIPILESPSTNKLLLSSIEAIRAITTRMPCITRYACRTRIRVE